jgi:ribonucleotide reductase alpha subunit
MKKVPAKDLWDQIAYAAWRCADPGTQYDTTINEWHTCPEGGKYAPQTLALNICFSTIQLVI